MNHSTDILSVSNICKDFDGLQVLKDISFNISPGAVVAIVGENGAGKSTLMKIISGALQPSSGTLTIGGETYQEISPKISKDKGIEIIYQENVLVPVMSVVDNLFIGKEISKNGIMDFQAMKKHAQKTLEFLDISLDLDRTVESLSIAEQQYVKILKSILFDPKLLIMDEPTSMFNVHDAQKVLSIVRRIVQKGISVLYISHFLEEVVQISDRILVLRDGVHVSSIDNAQKNTPLKQIATEMVGRDLDVFYIKKPTSLGEEVLRLENFCPRSNFSEISFSLRKGEILGIAGMVGSGRTSLVKAIAGAVKPHSGSFYLNGKLEHITNPREAIRHKIAYITEDRQKLGLMLGHSVTANTVIVGLKNKIRSWITSLKSQDKYIQDIIMRLNVKTSSLSKEVRYLSGGNQQKVVLGKWIFEDSDIFIFDEPTRGIDINSKHEFYTLINELAQKGKSIIVVSSEMPEIIALSDRILVMKNHSVVKELAKEDFSEEKIITYALGV